MQLVTCSWYNCLAWAFAQVLGRQLSYSRYTLTPNLPIERSFIQKASQFGIKVVQVDNFNQLHNSKFGFLVFGFWLEEVRDGTILDYQESGFHVVLSMNQRLFHQNGCGVLPTATSMEELQSFGYTNPIFFAVREQE